MVTKFTRKELERIGRTEEEIDLVLKYQKKLPVLIENNNVEQFSIDARLLWEQLDKPPKSFFISATSCVSVSPSPVYGTKSS